ncbi:hypothetical protein ABTP95_21960, partial [Acinetobacter baumannii]
NFASFYIVLHEPRVHFLSLFSFCHGAITSALMCRLNENEQALIMWPSRLSGRSRFTLLQPVCIVLTAGDAAVSPNST